MPIRSLSAAVFLACQLASPATAQDEDAMFLRALPFEAVVGGGLGEIGDLQGTPPPDTPLEERVLETFREKAMTDPQSVGLAQGAVEVLDALRPAGQPSGMVRSRSSSCGRTGAAYRSMATPRTSC